MSAGDSGLNDAQVDESRKANGENILTKKKGKSFIARLFINLGDPVIRILLCVLVINIVFTSGHADWFETGGIAVSIFLASFISTLSEYGSETAFRRLSAQSAGIFCRVRRNGSITEIPIGSVVVGDIILIGAGDSIPADGILIKGRIRVDQSAMTGESKEAEKLASSDHFSDNNVSDPGASYSVFRGCTVLSGSGEMLVKQVGDATFLGGISGEIQTDTRDSPLKIRLKKLAGQICVLGYIAGAAVAVVYLLNTFIIDSSFDRALIIAKVTDIPFLLDKLFHALTLGLTVVVMAVPEGLPVMIAVVLSSNTKRMIKSNVLVRKPVGIEAAGSMNILFTDKTGTLTEGILSCGAVSTGGGKIYNDVASFRKSSPDAYELFRSSCIINSEAEAGINSSGHRCALGGNSTDRALLNSVINDIRDTDASATQRVPFDSAKKFSAAQSSNKSRTVFIKGAPDILIPHTGYRTDEYGRRTVYTKDEALRDVKKLTEGGKRVIMVAYSDSISAIGAIGGTLTLICYALLEDKIRSTASSTVEKLRGAGIHVVMITGDSLETAGIIARKCGILGGGTDIITDSSRLGMLSDEELKKLLPKIGVVARALPSDKSRLVRIAQDSGLVVGMTGDGINDAPALRLADVGFAMGDGTQVAKDAGDIILLDDNIGSVANAVLFGRNIFKSIRKFITLQLMMNFCAVGISMICPFLGIDSPVTVVQMLWINIFMDTLGGLAFAGEPAQESCMREAPKRRDEHILNGYMINEIVLHGSFTVGLCIAFLTIPSITGLFRFAPDNIYLLTAFFALFIFSSVFNCFNARTDRLRLFAGIEDNKPFVIIMTAVLLIQLFFVYMGGSVLRTAPLTLYELGITSLIALSVFPAEFLRKLLIRLIYEKDRTGY